MKNKIEPSSVLNGKQTAYHYEIKYYLKYLQFTLTMSNVGKSEARLKQLITNQTPLSLLEECYISVFSVARYYVQNSVEPSRGFGTNSGEKVKDLKQPDENIFFGKLKFISDKDSVLPSVLVLNSYLSRIILFKN